MIQVLLVLPEEVDSRHLRLGANRRQQVREMLSGSSEYIIQFLDTVITSQPSPAQLLSCVRCYSSWLTLGVIPLTSVVSSPIMVTTVSSLQTPHSPPDLHEASTECLTSLLFRLEKEDCPELEMSVVQTVQQLAGPYQAAVAEEDSDKCLNFCR